jgi:hypothetical protein
MWPAVGFPGGQTLATQARTRQQRQVRTLGPEPVVPQKPVGVELGSDRTTRTSIVVLIAQRTEIEIDSGERAMESKPLAQTPPEGPHADAGCLNSTALGDADLRQVVGIMHDDNPNRPAHLQEHRTIMPAASRESP